MAAPAPPVCAPKGTKLENFENFREIFFWKTKSDKMCHMRACMGWSFRDVKALYLVNLLRQKHFEIFEKNFMMNSLGKFWIFDQKVTSGTHF